MLEGLYSPLCFNIYSKYCLSQQRQPNSVSKLQFSHALGLSGRSWIENESDVCGGRGRYEILYLTNVKNPPTYAHRVSQPPQIFTRFSIVFVAQQIPTYPFDSTILERKACKKNPM